MKKIIIFLLFVFANCYKIPDPPTDLKGDCKFYNTIQLKWKDNSYFEKGFIIERSENSGEFITIAKTKPNAEYFNDKDLNANSEYAYRVTAYNIKGKSAPTEIIEFEPDFNLRQLFQINQTIFNKYFSSATYTRFDDSYIIEMDKRYFWRSPIQLLLLDRQKGSVLFIPSKYKIIEFSDKTIIKEPVAIVADKTRNLFVSDISDNRIVQLKAKRFKIKFKKVFYNNIKAIDLKIDSESNILAIDANNNTIVVINKDGEKIKEFNVVGENKFNDIRCFTLDNENNMYIYDHYNKQLLIADSSGNFLSKQYIEEIIQVTDIAVSNNSIYLVSNNINKIYVLRKSDYKYMGAFTSVDYGEPWGKMEGMHSLSVLPDMGILVVLDINGGSLYTETAFNVIRE